MGFSRADEDLSVSIVPDAKQRRRDFDRRLAAYVRGHRERWDITAVLEPLHLGVCRAVDCFLVAARKGD